MTTKAQLQAWLKSSSAIRVVLVEITGVGGAPSSSFFLSNRPYTSKASDSPANQVYDACISGGVTFSQSLDLSGGSAQLSFGDIEIDNTPSTSANSGVRDGWLGYLWANKPVTILIGDATWSRADFYPVFNGLIFDIDSKSRTTLNLILVDKLQKLNVPISDVSVSGSTSAATNAQLIPLTLGECFNITPLVVNAPNLVYQVHNGAMQGLIEVRDNGVKITSYTEDLATGKFTLTANPAGTITCSVQGSTLGGTYSNSLGSIISYLLRNYGSGVTVLDLDDTLLKRYDNVNGIATSVGIYLSDRQNLLDVCQQLAFSVGAYLTTAMDEASGRAKFRLVQLQADYLGAADYSVTPSDIEFHSLQLNTKVDVEGSVKLAYCKNWTPQESGLANGITPQNVAVLNKEWFYSTVSDSTTLTAYSLKAEPEQRDTYLITKAKADAESARLLALKKTPRYIYTATYLAHMLPVELGDWINIKNSRFGLTTGKTGQVISIDRDWLQGRVTIGVFI